ncbi:MAG: hypothetical protein E7184_03920 [Erysipelotrichaceae bacterium]|nr:hypothetical protein [Erysipelotrichaceae bacterium]
MTLTNILILGTGVMIGSFISSKANKSNFKICETPETIYEDMKECFSQLYDEIKNITVDDVKNSLMSKYKKLKKKFDSIDFSSMKEKGMETMDTMKKSIKNLKKEVKDTMEK